MAILCKCSHQIHSHVVGGERKACQVLGCRCVKYRSTKKKRQDVPGEAIVAVTLPAEVRDSLGEAARRDNRSRAQFIRLLLMEWYERRREEGGNGRRLAETINSSDAGAPEGPLG